MSRAAAVWLVLTAVAGASTAAPREERWPVRSAAGRIAFHIELARDLGIGAGPQATADADGRLGVAFSAAGDLELLASGSVFRDLAGGELLLESGAAIRLGRTDVPLKGATLRRGLEPRTLALLGADGAPLFSGDHMHSTVDRAAHRLRLFNVDLRLTPESARLLGHERFAGMAVAVLELAAPVSIAEGAMEEPGGACASPTWGAPSNDVALIHIEFVQQMAREGAFPDGRIAIAPSATLKNVGSTDVPWYGKFTGPFPPYGNDQHPFLVWNMYRVANGAIEQIGVSPLKHAFFAVNRECGCPGGNILWATCEDIYGTGTNDSINNLGPRHEVTARSGVWERCWSLFDPDCDGVQNGIPPRASPMDRRMAVAESDLQTPGATYYLDAWYLVRDDVDIFNNMGWRRVIPTPGSTWTFGLGTTFTTGPVIDQWVDPAAPGPNAQSVLLDTRFGRLKVAVRATDLGGGRWRYEYALMNFDFDPRVKSFSVPLPPGAMLTDIGFHDPDANPATDWPATVAGGRITWLAPSSQATAAQDYGTLFNFRFTANAAPSAPGGAALELRFLEARAWRLRPNLVGPGGLAPAGQGRPGQSPSHPPSSMTSSRWTLSRPMDRNSITCRPDSSFTSRAGLGSQRSVFSRSESRKSNFAPPARTRTDSSSCPAEPTR
jgi:hypothetical protein